MSRLLRLCVFLPFAIAVSSAPALAHITLIGSAPAANSNLVVVPREIRLIFSQPPETALTTLELRGPNGAVALDSVTSAAGNVLVAAIAGPLYAGAYVVAWRTVSRDGHPVRGEFAFSIAPDAVGAVTLDPVHSQPDLPAKVPATALVHDSLAPLATLLRWLTLVGIVVTAGGVVFVTFIARRLERTMDADVRASYLPSLLDGAHRLGLAAAAALLVTSLLRLAAQSAALGGDVGQILTGTVWGTAWMLHTLGAGIAAAGFGIARRGLPRGPLLAAAGVLIATVGLGMSGHAVSVSSPALAVVALHVVHALAASAWLGSLLVIAAVALPLSFRMERDDRWQVVADVVHVFSPMALACVAVAVFAGALIALVQLPSLASVLGSEYGRVLLLKLTLVALTAGVGAYNWQRVRPRLGELPGARRLRRSATIELAIGALVLAVTAVLVATPMPQP